MSITNPKFGELAIHNSEFSMSSEERLRYGLENPGAKHTLSLSKTDKITTARIRYALSELAALNMDEAQGWLREVAKQSPKVAFELYLQLLEFSVPRLKAIAVEVNDPGADARRLSYADLMKVVSEQ